MTPFTINSVIENGSFFLNLHWIIVGPIVICLAVILLNFYVYLSFSKPDLILKKTISSKYKEKFQNAELVYELNKIRKLLLKLSMIWNFISVILLGCFWYIFEKLIAIIS